MVRFPMRAAVAREYGPPEAIRVEELPAPVPGPGAVRVRVRAAAVNFSDLLLLANRYQIQAPLPFVPGSEFAGEVEALGGGVTALAPGDRVFGATLVGAFAEALVSPASVLARIPDSVGFVSAAAFGVAYGTAWGALDGVASLRAGETLLVLGAAGGVGLAGVEIGRFLGAHVIAAASSDEKRALCLAKGAERTLDSAPEGLRDRLREVLGGKGTDVVLDPVGGDATEAALRSLALGGRHVVVGFAAGGIPRIPTHLLLLRNARLLGFEIAGYQRLASADFGAGRAQLLELLGRGVLSPHVGARFPLEETTAALRLVADRRALGKIVIEP